MSILEKIYARARERNAKVVFPELGDPRAVSYTHLMLPTNREV